MASFDKVSDARHGVINNSGRPMSAVSRMTGNSKMTYVPELSRQQLMVLATDIYKSRSPLSEILKGFNVSMRTVISSSQIL
jgi:hypothetical protein